MVLLLVSKILGAWLCRAHVLPMVLLVLLKLISSPLQGYYAYHRELYEIIYLVLF